MMFRDWAWPVPGCGAFSPKIGDILGEDGTFGFVRKNEVHTGSDLYCAVGQSVVAVDDGMVVLVPIFTGPDAGSPWWNPTWAVIVDHRWGTVVYGELQPDVAVGTMVAKGQRLGSVLQVRKPEDADGKPMTMLHFELWEDAASVLRFYESGRENVASDWPVGTPMPKGLMDPSELLDLTLRREMDSSPRCRACGHRASCK